MSVLTQFPLLKALGWALFNSLWQMAVLWLLYLLFIWVFQASAARIRHGLAFLLLSAGSVWSAATFLVSWLFREESIHTGWLTLLSPAQSAPGWFREASRSFMDMVLSYGSSVYLLILGGLLIRYANQYRNSRKLTREGLSTLPADFRVFVQSTGYRMGIRTPVRAWLSSLVDVPLTIGLLRPVILLPIAMMSRLTPQQVEAILVHELAHIRRKDYLLHLLVTAMEGLYFFNPFARLLVRQLKKERENSCDDTVLQFQYNPHAYVSALLSLATHHRGDHRLAVAATGSGDQLLLQRARRILRQESGKPRTGIRPLILLFCTVGITALSVFSPLHPGKRRTLVARAASSNLIRINTITPRGEMISPAEISPAELSARLNPGPGRAIAAAIPASPIVNHSPARHPVPRVARADQDDLPSDDNDNSVFINTAGNDGIAAAFGTTDDDNKPAEATGADDGQASDNVYRNLYPSGAVNTALRQEPASAGSRDYSLDESGSVTTGNSQAAPGSGPQFYSTPFVPNSSFAFQYTLDDSSQLQDQLIYLQQSGQEEILAAISRLQQQMTAQFKALTALRNKTLAGMQARPDQEARLLDQFRAEQLKMQRQYIQKITDWQRKLEKTTHIRMIVYI